MATVGEGVVPIRADMGPFNKDIRGAEKGISSKFAGIGRAAKVAFLGASAGVAGAFVLGKEVMDTSAQLESWRKKTSTVFEGSAGDIRKWADKNNEIFGVTDDELAGLAASFGDLLKPMGFTAEQAATMSKDVVGLSGALSEWTGGQRSAAEVSNILSKAMLGEREGLKELGISITEAEVSARLLENGQQDLTGAALQQAKAQATQQLIMEKSTDAQAAYAAGGNKALRATNEIKAGFGELREQMADRLMPIVLKVTEWLGDQLPKVMDKAARAFATLSDWWNDNGPRIIDLVGTLGNVLKDTVDKLIAAVRFVVREWDKFKVALIAGVAIMLPALASFVVQIVIWELAVLKAWITTQAGAIKAAVVHSAQVAKMVAKWAFVGVQSLLHAAKVAAAWLIAMGPIALVIAAVAGVVALIIIHFDTIKETIGKAWTWVKDATSTAWNAIKSFVTATWDWIKRAAAMVFDAIKAYFSFVLNAYKTIFTTIWNAIKAVVEGVWNAIKWYVETYINAVKTIIETVLGTIQRIWDTGWNIIKTAVTTIVETIKTTISNTLTDIVGFFTALPGRVVDTIKLGYQIILDVGKWVVKTMLDGIKSILTLGAWFTGLPKRLVDMVMEKAGQFINMGKKIIEKIIEGIKSMPGAIGDAISGIVGKIKLPSVDLNPLNWGDGPGAPPPGAMGGGSALKRVQAVLSRFPGVARISSTYRDPARNARAGGSPTSYHMDRNNPAVDIVPASAAIGDQIAAVLRQAGPWREFLWRVPNHAPGDNMHIHVAHQGGAVTPFGIDRLRHDELLTKLQVGETVLPKDFTGSGSGITIEQVHLHDGVDVDLLGSRLVFQLEGAL